MCFILLGLNTKRPQNFRRGTPKCSGLKPSCPASEAPHSCSPALSCPSGTSKKTRGSRSRQFDKWSNDEEERKNKTTTKKNTPLKKTTTNQPTNQQAEKMRRQSLNTSHKQTDAQSVSVNGYFSKPSFPSVFFCCIRCQMRWTAQVSCPDCVPFQLPFTPNQLAVWAAWKMEEALMLCRHCSAISKTWVCHQHGFGHKSSIQHHKGCYEEGQFHPGQTLYTHLGLLSPCT